MPGCRIWIRTAPFLAGLLMLAAGCGKEPPHGHMEGEKGHETHDKPEPGKKPPAPVEAAEFGIVRLKLLRQDGAPLDLSKIEGTLILQPEELPQERIPLKAVRRTHGGEAGHGQVVSAGDYRVEMTFVGGTPKGEDDPSGDPVFEAPVRLKGYSCSMRCEIKTLPGKCGVCPMPMNAVDISFKAVAMFKIDGRTVTATGLERKSGSDH